MSAKEYVAATKLIFTSHLHRAPLASSTLSPLPLSTLFVIQAFITLLIFPVSSPRLVSLPSRHFRLLHSLCVRVFSFYAVWKEMRCDKLKIFGPLSLTQIGYCRLHAPSSWSAILNVVIFASRLGWKSPSVSFHLSSLIRLLDLGKDEYCYFFAIDGHFRCQNVQSGIDA